MSDPSRRRVMTLLTGAVCLPAVACAPEPGPGTPTPLDTGSPVDTDLPEVCAALPPEIAGPFPGNGANGPDILELPASVRSDLRQSIGDFDGTAPGLPLTVRLRLVDAACAPLAGHAIYLWLCDRDGEYSMYTLETENWLRGVQVTDAEGDVEFVAVFPGCYPGRWPHVHLQVYPSLEATSDAANALVTSQLAFPKDTCDAVYATEGYEASAAALVPLALDADGAFRDGAETQLFAMSGDAATGFTASLTLAL